MTPKEYLNQALLIDEKIENNLEIIECLKSRLYGISNQLSDDVKIQNTNRVDFTDTVDKVIDLENKINDLVDEYVGLKQKITKEINSLDNNTYVLLLIKRYVLNKNLYDIADEMFYSYGRIRHMHGEALEAFKCRYPEKFNSTH